MKKIMIALAAVAVAACSQAASFSWTTSTTGKLYTPGDSETLLASGTAYLFDTSATEQAALVTAFANGTLNLETGSLSSSSISAGKITSATFNDSTAVGDTLTAFFATVVTVDEKDYLFISGTASASGLEGKTSKISFNAKAASQLAALDATGGYSSAGWYTAVPEPTSGLLLLLGMAGLALRRRRA